MRFMNAHKADRRRTRHEPHKAELLAAAIDYVVEHGLSELSIRPLAAALGISHRTLLYHFGSKEALVAAVLNEVRARERALLAPLDNPRETSAEAYARAAFRHFSAPEYERYFRLFFEVYGLALQQPAQYGGFLDGVVTDWLPGIERALVRDGYPPERAPALASLLLDSGRGMLLDLLATGDRARVEAAFEALLAGLRSLLPAAPPDSPPGEKSSPAAS